MKKILFIFISILAISCNDDDNVSTPLTEKTDLNLVTGINLRQTSDDTTLQLGNPNVLLNNKFLIFPNPANESVNVLSQENFTDIWFVPAIPEKIHQDVNFSSVLNSNLYSEQSLISNSIFSTNNQVLNNINLNIETLDKGYYKVFVKIDGEIYWDNLYKYENQVDNEQQFISISNFWN